MSLGDNEDPVVYKTFLSCIAQCVQELDNISDQPNLKEKFLKTLAYNVNIVIGEKTAMKISPCQKSKLRRSYSHFRRGVLGFYQA